MSFSFTAVVPVYNEREGVECSLRSLKTALDDHLDCPSEVVVVDDGSTDGTDRILAAIDGITVVTSPSNSGYGAAVKRGIRAASGSWILITDGDDSYPASNLPRLLENLSDRDMVVGARAFSSIANPALWNHSKALFQRSLAALIGHHIPDINSGMRVFRKDLAVTFEPILANGFSFSSGLTVSFLRAGLRVAFTDIDYVERKGRSKVRPWSFTPAFLRSVQRAYFGAPGLAGQLPKPQQ